jgi:hypothetical protein
VKPVNSHTSNEFHVWQRQRLAGIVGGLVDIDAWALICADQEDEPRALIELKRSHLAPLRWMPYADDRPSYEILCKFARRAQVPLLVVYFQKGVPIEDETPFRVLRMTRARPDYVYLSDTVMPAEEFATRVERMCYVRERDDRFTKVVSSSSSVSGSR